jgi:hypothetical protein
VNSEGHCGHLLTDFGAKTRPVTGCDNFIIEDRPEPSLVQYSCFISKRGERH